MSGTGSNDYDRWFGADLWFGVNNTGAVGVASPTAPLLHLRDILSIYVIHITCIGGSCMPVSGSGVLAESSCVHRVFCP